MVARLEQAGAVLVAKLTLGALAWGDVWFGGTTRNPWNPEQGSSGSSAGSASAIACRRWSASRSAPKPGARSCRPSTRCGTTGLRPTFGRVSRAGAMALSWSMDKLGPICRTVEDCAARLRRHPRPRRPRPRRPSTPASPGTARPVARSCGSATCRRSFEPATRTTRSARWRTNDLAVLEVLRGLGVELIPIDLPDLPVSALSFILTAEAAAAFDELTRSGRDDAAGAPGRAGLAQRLPPGAD